MILSVVNNNLTMSCLANNSNSNSNFMCYGQKTNCATCKELYCAEHIANHKHYYCKMFDKFKEHLCVSESYTYCSFCEMHFCPNHINKHPHSFCFLFDPLNQTKCTQNFEYCDVCRNKCCTIHMKSHVHYYCYYYDNNNTNACDTSKNTCTTCYKKFCNKHIDSHKHGMVNVSTYTNILKCTKCSNPAIGNTGRCEFHGNHSVMRDSHGDILYDGRGK